MSPRRCSVDMGMRYGKELSVREEWPFKTHPFPRDSRAQADLRCTVTLFFLITHSKPPPSLQNIF